MWLEPFTFTDSDSVEPMMLQHCSFWCQLPLGMSNSYGVDVDVLEFCDIFCQRRLLGGISSDNCG